MRSALLVLGAAVLWAGCREAGPSGSGATSSGSALVARWHFVGGDRLRSQTDAPSLRNVLSLPTVSGVGSRLGTNLTRLVLDRVPGSPGRAAEGRIYPLVEAILENESVGEVTTTEWNLAVRGADLPVAALAEAVALLPRPAGGAAPTVVTTNGWWLAASSPAQAGKAAAHLRPGSPLSGYFDLPVILGKGHEAWPKVDVQLVFTNAAVRTSAQLEFAQAPMGELEAWKVPDQFIRDPLVRFSAIRGAGPLIERMDWPKFLLGGRTPGQVVSWAQPEVPFRSWFAFPVDDITKRVERIHEDVKPFFGTTNQPGPYRGQVALHSNHTAVAVFGKQMACTPRVVGATQAGESYLVVGFFQGKTNNAPMPAELLAQLQKPNLAFFEWEITSESWPNWNVLAQYNQILLGRAPNEPNARAHRWMSSLTNQLGNAVTQVERQSPTRFTFTRKSDVGLNGLELVALTRWLDAGFGALAGRGPVAPPLPNTKP